MATVSDTPTAESRWLKCKLDKGMFSDEIAVTYPPEGNAQKSVFVAKSLVDGTPGERGRVLVRLIRKDGSVIAVLPSANADFVNVREKDVEQE